MQHHQAPRPTTTPCSSPCRAHAAAMRRRATIVRLHKALDTQAPSVLETAEEVTFECLTLLRRPQLSRLLPYLQPLQPPATSPTAPTAPLAVSEQSGYLHSPVSEQQGHAAATSVAQHQPSCQGNQADAEGEAVPVQVGHLTVLETGPLAPCSGFMDAAARRVLPHHLLRRCRILSSLQLGGTCRQRVAVTARSGEESIFNWQLVRVDLPPPSHSMSPSSHSTSSSSHSTSPSQPTSPSSQSVSPITLPPEVITRPSQDDGLSRAASSGTATASPITATASPSNLTPNPDPSYSQPFLNSASTLNESSDEESAPPVEAVSRPAAWRVRSVTRDEALDGQEVVGGPHPRLSPELVILQQLRELSRGNLQQAAAHMAKGESASQAVALRALLRQPSHHSLLTHSAVQLQGSALPDERTFWQHVCLLPSGRGSITLDRGRGALDTLDGLPGASQQQQGSSSYVWQLRLQASGCWLIDGIVRVPTSV